MAAEKTFVRTIKTPVGPVKAVGYSSARQTYAGSTGGKSPSAALGSRVPVILAANARQTHLSK